MTGNAEDVPKFDGPNMPNTFEGDNGARRNDPFSQMESLYHSRRRHGQLFSGLFSLRNCQCLSVLTKRRFKNENMIILALIQILCGLAAIILSSVAITKGVFLYKMATGLWAGFIMVATGIHCILTALRTQVCTLISLLIWSILSSLTSTLLICVSVAGLIEDSDKFQKLQYSEPQNYVNQKMFLNNPTRFHQIILHILLLIVGCLEASVGISTALFCCRALCPIRSRLDRSNFTNLLIAVPDGNKKGANYLGQSKQLPYFYSNVSSFLPKSPENAVILTQISSNNNVAITAAQAAATCINYFSSLNESPVQEVSNGSLTSIKSNEETNVQINDLMGDKRQPSNIQILSCKDKNLRSLDKLLRTSKRTSLIYVMPSPNNEDPPTIFPPFPPPYSPIELSKEKIHITPNQLENHRSHISPNQNVNGTLQLLQNNRRNQVPFGSLSRPSSIHSGNRSHPYQIGGDRILHPVLIIERPTPKPPSYQQSANVPAKSPGERERKLKRQRTIPCPNRANESPPPYKSRSQTPDP